MSVAGLERMTTGSVAKRLTLSRHTGRQSTTTLANEYVSVWGGGGAIDVCPPNFYSPRFNFMATLAFPPNRVLHLVSKSTT